MNTEHAANDVSEIVEINGWKLSLSHNEEEFFIRDIDLGAKVGKSRARDIRALIKKHYDLGNLPGTICREAHARQSTGNGGEREYTVIEYHLPEEDALFIVTQCETVQSVALTKEMIHVYKFARKGMLGGDTGQLRQQLAALTQLVQILQTQSEQFKTNHQLLVERMRDEQQRIIATLSLTQHPGMELLGYYGSLGLTKKITELRNVMNANSRIALHYKTIDNELRAAVGYRSGLWQHAPKSVAAEALSMVETHLRAEQRRAQKSRKPKQTVFPFVVKDA